MGGLNNGQGTVFRFGVVPAGTLQFNSATYNVNEGSGTATIIISRANGSTGAISVSYATADGTASSNNSQDYTAESGTLAWADGDTADKTFQIPITDRHLTTGNVATVSLAITMPTGGAALGLVSQATLNITQNEVLVQPTVTLTSPPDSLTVVVGSSLLLAANVNDPSGLLSSVQFQIDGQPVGTAPASGPYTFAATAPATPGAHQITVVAIDNQNRQNTSSHGVTVVAADPANPPPSVAILTSLDQRSLAAGSSLTLDVSAATADGTPLQRVDFYANGTLFASFDGAGNVITSLYPVSGRPTRRDASNGLTTNAVFQAAYQLPGADELVTLLAVALDKLGRSTVSGTATVHSVLNTSDHAPAVTLTDTSNGAPVMVGTALSLPLAVNDPDTSGNDAAISKVEYFVNDKQAQVVTSAPFSNFSFTPTAAGKYVLSAVATDGGGLAGFSAPVTINAVSPGTVPSVSIAASGDAKAVEGGEAGKVVVRRTGDMTKALTVGYKAKGSAKSGVDYKTLSGSVTIPAGAATAKIKVKPIDGSPNAGTLTIKIVLVVPADGSYEVDTGTAKLKLIGK